MMGVGAKRIEAKKGEQFMVTIHNFWTLNWPLSLPLSLALSLSPIQNELPIFTHAHPLAFRW